MTETDLCYLSALQLRELYQKGEVSPVEVTEAVLRRMDQLNPKLNAFITTTPELALEGSAVSPNKPTKLMNLHPRWLASQPQ